MVKVLAMDSSTVACSVAVRLDGRTYELFETGENLHSARMLPMVRDVLAETALDLRELDCLGVGIGPGSFTGLRIGVGIAQGLASAVGLPVVPVSSLAALAEARECEQILPGLDARMGEVYWACYTRNGPGNSVSLSGEEHVSGPGEVVLAGNGGWLAIGTAWTQYAGLLPGETLEKIQIESGLQYPRASDVAAIAEAGYLAGCTQDAGSLVPSYIRDDVARKSNL